VPYSTGGIYVNDIGSEADDGTAMIRSPYGGNYPRLVEMKSKYDLANLFREEYQHRLSILQSN
jgi:hypothetical protein